MANLRARGLVYNIRYAEQKLAAILNAYQKEGKVAFNREIETPGFYLIDGKVASYTNRDLHLMKLKSVYPYLIDLQ